MAISFKPRDIILFSLILVLFLFGLASFFRNQVLEKQVRELNVKAKDLQQKVDTLTGESDGRRELLRTLEKNNKDLKRSLETIRKDNEALQNSLKKNDADLKAAQEEKTYLEEMLINKTKEAENKAREAEVLKQNAPLPAAVAPVEEIAPPPIPGTAEDLIRQIRQKDDEIKNLTEQNKILSEKLDTLYKTTSARIAEINSAKAALEDTVDKARKRIDDEWNTVNLGSINLAKTGTAGSVPEVPAPVKKPAGQEGQVMVINREHGFVVIDLGQTDGITPATRFAVMRDGARVAGLSVLEIQDKMTACTIAGVEPGKTIQEKDTVTVEPPA